MKTAVSASIIIWKVLSDKLLHNSHRFFCIPVHTPAALAAAAGLFGFLGQVVQKFVVLYATFPMPFVCTGKILRIVLADVDASQQIDKVLLIKSGQGVMLVVDPILQRILPYTYTVFDIFLFVSIDSLELLLQGKSSVFFFFAPYHLCHSLQG